MVLVVEVLRTAYPEVEYDIIKSDVIGLIDELAAKNLLDNHRIFDTRESLSRERSECIGYDLCGATAMSAGFYRAAFGSMLNTLFNRWAFMPCGCRSWPY